MVAEELGVELQLFLLGEGASLGATSLLGAAATGGLRTRPRHLRQALRHRQLPTQEDGLAGAKLHHEAA
eukprot:3827087-Pyramimonas_sp.AAC.1